MVSSNARAGSIASPADLLDCSLACILYTREPGQQEVSFAYTDTDAEARKGAQYYYVRVEQADGHVAWAWSSPIWVNY